MSDDSILGGISDIGQGIVEAGSAAADFVGNVGAGQIASAAAFGDTVMAGADRMVAGAAYAAGMDDTAQEYRDAGNAWAQSRSDNLDVAAQAYGDAGRDIWGSNPPTLPDVGTGGWDNPAIMDMGMGGDAAGTAADQGVSGEANADDSGGSW